MGYFSDIFNSIFNHETIITLIWFLAVYYIFYLIVGLFFGYPGTPQLFLSKTIDFIILSLLLTYLIYTYYTVSLKNKQDLFYYVLDEFKRELKDPMTIVYVGFILAFLYIFSYTFRMSDVINEKPFTLYLLEQKLWIYICVLIIIDFFTFILKIPIVDFTFFFFGNIWNSLTDTSKSSTTETSPPTTADQTTTPPSTESESFDTMKKVIDETSSSQDNIEAYEKIDEYSTYNNNMNIKKKSSKCSNISNKDSGFVPSQSINTEVHIKGIDPSKISDNTIPKNQDQNNIEKKNNLWETIMDKLNLDTDTTGWNEPLKR